MTFSKKLWALVLGFAALHLLLGLYLPLVEDETYYQLWASVPSAGYYDHPPMIAWWIAVGQWAFGETVLGVRVMSVLASALATLLTYRIGWVFTKDVRVAFAAALWGKAMVPFAVLGFAATPDAPSVLFWTAAVWALAEVLCGGSRNWWLAVGVFAGLGVLSKLTDLFFGLSLVIWLLAARDGRRWLGVWQVWLGAALGILTILPFLWWNYQHDWVGLERQFGRIGTPGHFVLGDFLSFFGSIILLMTPLIFWLALRSVARRETPRVLIWLAAPIFIYLSYHATKTLAGGQWLVPTYPALAVMAAITAPKGWIAKWAAPLGFGLAAVVLIMGFWPGKVFFPGHNPFTQVRGWAPVTAELQDIATKNDVKWIATEAYGLTGQLHHRLTPLGYEVRAVTAPQRYLFLPPIGASLCDAPALFVSRMAHPDGVPYFAHSEPGPDIIRREEDIVLMRYHTAIVSGLRGCGG